MSEVTFSKLEHLKIWLQAALVIWGNFICKFTYSLRQAILLKHANFIVKNGLYISEFSIHNPKWRNISTANNKGKLYFKIPINIIRDHINRYVRQVEWEVHHHFSIITRFNEKTKCVEKKVFTFFAKKNERRENDLESIL